MVVEAIINTDYEPMKQSFNGSIQWVHGVRHSSATQTHFCSFFECRSCRGYFLPSLLAFLPLSCSSWSACWFYVARTLIRGRCGCFPSSRLVPSTWWPGSLSLVSGNFWLKKHRLNFGSKWTICFSVWWMLPATLLLCQRCCVKLTPCGALILLEKVIEG